MSEFAWWAEGWGSLTTEFVEGSALPLQSIDDIHSSDSLPLGVLSVGDSITDDILKENLEDTSGLLIYLASLPSLV